MISKHSLSRFTFSFFLCVSVSLWLTTASAQDTPGIGKCPATVDSLDSLFRIRDNARATTTATMAVNATSIEVDSTAGFDITGSGKIGAEVFYYTLRTPTSLSGLSRGMSGTTIASHASGSIVTSPILADHHNVLAAAIICAQGLALANVGSGIVGGGDYGATDNVTLMPPVIVGGATRNTNLSSKKIFDGFPGDGTPENPNFWGERWSSGVSNPFPYDLRTQVTGKPASAAMVLRFVAVRPVNLAATGHRCSAGTAATAQADFVLAVNGASKGTLRFAAAGTTCSLVSGSAASIVAGDVVTITGPTQDATLADIAFSLFATLP